MEKGEQMKFRTSSAVVLFFGFLLPVYPSALPGKAAYNASCRNCHGPEGKGDRMSDSFYKVTIPRLNSNYVQEKSDDELKKIIIGGVRKMGPAKMGAPSSPHSRKITPEQADEVIQYVRTLKK
jgi:mono/diheme cytochrome c family protein